jgi:hypothetical protein
MDRLVGNDHLVEVILTSWWVMAKSISTVLSMSLCIIKLNV